ncbi:MAG: SpoIID/LytB domain-containing protein, partial [Clostridia bacterium]|nr:SpoIID/LytB domain-containing protein [Clostridia bacterium]
VPELPEEIELVNNVPQISVYKVDEKTTETMDLETYLMGVLAGEMNNSWPMEALKAQAILARTFVLNFISEKDSMYEDADISTDIREAQAYDAANINDRIRDAVKQTAGLVVAYDGRFAQTWFHAHSGGMTELPTAGLEYKNADPPYMQAIKSPESDKAPASVQNWTWKITQTTNVRPALRRRTFFFCKHFPKPSNGKLQKDCRNALKLAPRL